MLTFLVFFFYLPRIDEAPAPGTAVGSAVMALVAVFYRMQEKIMFLEDWVRFGVVSMASSVPKGWLY